MGFTFVSLLSEQFLLNFVVVLGLMEVKLSEAVNMYMSERNLSLNKSALCIVVLGMTLPSYSVRGR